MLALAADKCVHGAIVRGLRRRVPAIDLVTADEAGLAKALDQEILEWTAKENRVLVTQDWNTLIGLALNRVAAGEAMPGVIVCGKGVTIGDAIDDLEVVAHCGVPEDFKDQIRFLPL